VSQIFPRFEIPEKIYTDNWTHFENNVISLMTKNLRIDLRNHCAYHPQSAGLLERDNGMSKLEKKIKYRKLGKIGFTV